MKTPSGIYLDHNATTPMSPKVLEAMLPYLTEIYGNASSLHEQGISARYGVEKAREEVADALGVSSDWVVFTGSGTEANNLCVRGAVLAAKTKTPHIILSEIEHSSVKRMAEELEKNHNARLTWVGVGRNGQVKVEEIEAAMERDTVLVCLMAANNETGIKQPVERVATLCGEKRVVFHSDCVQLFGKAPLPAELNAPHITLSISGHKIYGPKGVGAAVLSPGLQFPPQIFGGDQERGLRSGTENVPSIVALGTAALSSSDLKASESLLRLKTALWQTIKAAFPDTELNGEWDLAMPGTLSLSIPFVKGPDVVRMLSGEGVYISAGSACSSGRRELSPVIKALGLDPTIPWGAIRISLGHRNTEEEIQIAGEKIVGVLKTLRSEVV